MNIYYIREFIEIARLNSFSEAAAELSLSQSALSKHIQSLERELDTLLFDRSTRSVKLNVYGQIFLPIAKQMSALHDDLLQKIDVEKKQGKLTLKLASIPVMAQYDITGLITRFQKDYPEIKLQIIESEGNDINHLLEDDRCELAFTRRVGNHEEANFEYFTYSQDRLCALLPKHHPLSKEKKISLSTLKDEFFLFMDERTLLYRFCYDACLDAGFEPNIVYSGHRPENIMDLTAKGAGIALLMKKQCSFFANKHVQTVEIAPVTEADVCLTRMKKSRLTHAAQIFWNYVTKDINSEK